MNIFQRRIVIVATIVVVALLLYVPWTTGTSSRGYSFIFAPPNGGYGVTVDTGRVAMAVLAAVTLAVAGFVLAKKD